MSLCFLSPSLSWCSSSPLSLNAVSVSFVCFPQLFSRSDRSRQFSHWSYFWRRAVVCIFKSPTTSTHPILPHLLHICKHPCFFLHRFFFFLGSQTCCFWLLIHRPDFVVCVSAGFWSLGDGCSFPTRLVNLDPEQPSSPSGSTLNGWVTMMKKIWTNLSVVE